MVVIGLNGSKVTAYRPRANKSIIPRHQNIYSFSRRSMLLFAKKYITF